MRVGINAQLCSPASSYRNAGVSQYVRQLLTAIGDLESAPDMHLFLPRNNQDAFPACFRVHRPALDTDSRSMRIAWEQAALPIITRRLKLDVLHCPMHVLPAICPTKSVVTVLDLTFMRYPETFPSAQRRYLEFFTRRGVRKADAVIAISECTRGDVIESFGVPESKVATTLLGVDECFQPVSEEAVERIRRRYGLGDINLLYVGTLEPRKNIPTLLTAFDAARKAVPGDVNLILAGGKGWFYDQVFRQIEELGIEERVRLTGYVPREDLPALYCAATAFVYPSLYEGFGLPPLEAMACGTPVITSNTSSLPEVVGDAGIMVDPHDTESLAESIVKVLNNAEIRDSMREKGLARAGKFSWKETARRTLNVYQNVCNEMGG